MPWHRLLTGVKATTSFLRSGVPSNAYPWMSLARDGVEARCVPTDNGGLTLRQVEALSTSARGRSPPAPSSSSQDTAPIWSPSAASAARDILFIVDAIQAIGHMKFDVQAMNIDILATGGMKSLLRAAGHRLYLRARERCRGRNHG